MLHLQMVRREGMWIGGGGKLFEDMLGAAKHLDDFPVGQGTSARRIFNGGFVAAAEDLTFEKSLRTEEALVCFDPETAFARKTWQWSISWPSMTDPSMTPFSPRY